jgi:hypothetical protein
MILLMMAITVFMRVTTFNKKSELSLVDGDNYHHESNCFLEEKAIEAVYFIIKKGEQKSAPLFIK